MPSRRAASVDHIVLVRHGSTAWSGAGKHTGRTDIPLTTAGEREARSLRPALRGLSDARIFVSPMQRARRTCELAGLGPKARVMPELTEWNYGDYEGLTSEEIHRERPRWTVLTDGAPHGESVADVRRRADRLIARLERMRGTVVLVSHGHFLRSLAARWLGKPIAFAQSLVLDTASVSVLGFEKPDKKSRAIRLWNAKGLNRPLER